MKAYEIKDEFGLDNLTLVDRPHPEPGPGQVVLNMKAMSLNYRDLLMIKGHYNPRQPLPLVPFSDGVGHVTALGEGVENLEVGARVCPIFSQKWLAGPPNQSAMSSSLGGPLDGTLAESMVVDANALVRPPDHLTDAEAACLPCAAVTAWSALVTQGGVTAGDTILVQGTGGVSMFALQIGVALGARVIATSSSNEKLEEVEKMGAFKTLNYVENPEWGKLIRRELTQGRGVDHVVEVGGAGTLEQSLEAVRIGGSISMIGVLSGTQQSLSVIPILMRQVRVQGIFVGSKANFEALNRAIAHHEIRPRISHRFGFDAVDEALRCMDAGNHFGKIVVEVSR